MSIELVLLLIILANLLLLDVVLLMVWLKFKAFQHRYVDPLGGMLTGWLENLKSQASYNAMPMRNSNVSAKKLEPKDQLDEKDFDNIV